MPTKRWFNVIWMLVAVAASHSVAQSSKSIGVDLFCPDGVECPDESTCCELGTGAYGCCPFPDAVCCSDHLHCCPADSVCDEEHGYCKRGAEILHSWVESKVSDESSHRTNLVKFSLQEKTDADEENSIFPNLKNAKKDIVCPGGNQTCAVGYTCCMSVAGDYGCCPLQDAVCCADHIHCCPKGSFCDTKAGKCSKSMNSNVNNVICPGREFQCPDHTTCCSLKSGQYGCCPLENATCCSDEVHCCPSGYKCGEGGICSQSNSQSSLPAFALN